MEKEATASPPVRCASVQQYPAGSVVVGYVIGHNKTTGEGAVCNGDPAAEYYIVLHPILAPGKTVAVDTLRYADEAVSVIDLNGCLTIETGVYAAIRIGNYPPLIRA